MGKVLLMNGNEWIIVIYTQNINLHQLFMVNGCVFNLLDDEILENWELWSRTRTALVSMTDDWLLAE